MTQSPRKRDLEGVPRRRAPPPDIAFSRHPHPQAEQTLSGCGARAAASHAASHTVVGTMRTTNDAAFHPSDGSRTERSTSNRPSGTRATA